MGLPSALRSRMRPSTEKNDPPSPSSPSPQVSAAQQPAEASDNVSFKRATRMRKGFALSASVAYLLSWIFLVLVLIGNTYNRPVLSSICTFVYSLLSKTKPN